MKRLLILIPVIVFLSIALLIVGGNFALNTPPIRATIQDAVQRATAHEARITGRFAVVWSLTPTVGVDDVALLNPPGFSRPDLLTIRHVEASIALLPLLQGRVEIPTLSIVAPDLLLERDATGRANWQTRPPPTTTPSPDPAAPRPRTPTEIHRVQVSEGRLEFHGVPALQIPTLELAPSGGPISGTLLYNGVTLALAGRAGPAAAPLTLSATSPGVAVTLDGSPVPLDATLSVTASNLTDAARLVGRDLPPLRDVTLTAHLGPDGLTALQARTGAADLATILPGLRLNNAAAVTGAPGQPIHATAEATLNDLPVYLVLDTGPPAGAMPLKAQFTADAATATIQGTLDLATRVPELTVSARIPDLQALGVRASLALPSLTDTTLDLRLLPAPGGAGVLLRGLRLASPQGDLAGDLAFGTIPRPSLRGSLIAQRLDLDAWTAPVNPSPTRLGARSGPRLGEGAAAPQPAPPSPDLPPLTTPAPATEPSWLIPDRPLPLAALRRLDTDLRLAVASLQSHGATYRNLETRLLLQDGRLRLDPLTLVTPGGLLQASLQLDTTATPPTTALMLRAPALGAAGVAIALGHADALTGNIDLDADLRASGATPHALASTLSGRLAITMTDGDIANDLLAALFGPALRGAGVPMDPTGRSRIRCLGLRLDATAGQASLPLIALDTTRLRLDGDGQLDLARETMDLHLRPTIRLGPTSVAIPIRLTGPFRAPKPAADKGVVAPGRFGISIGAAAPDPCARLIPGAAP